MDGALENLEKRVPKVKVGNRESLRQKDSVDIYKRANECFMFTLIGMVVLYSCMCMMKRNFVVFK